VSASHSISERLASGSSRGLGCANAIAAEVVHSPDVLVELVAAAQDKRAIVTIRAANALKKVQQERPDLLEPFAKKILHTALASRELQARWNLIIVVGRLPLRGRDRALGIELMFEALRSESGLLRTFAMQGLVDLFVEEASLRRRVRPIVEEFAKNGTAAMQARARKLLPLVREDSKRGY
jgi:hypothetical protein